MYKGSNKVVVVFGVLPTRTELPLSNISFDTHASINEMKTGSDNLQDMTCNLTRNFLKRCIKDIFINLFEVSVMLIQKKLSVLFTLSVFCRRSL